MTTNKRDKQYIVLASLLLFGLLLGSLIIEFNVIDFGYILILWIYGIRYYLCKE